MFDVDDTFAGGYNLLCMDRQEVMKMKRITNAIVCAVLAAGLLAGCGKVDTTQAAITVDDEAISYGAASFILRAQQAETATVMEGYGLYSADSAFWDQMTTGEDGHSVTYGEEMKKTLVNDLAGYVLLRRHASDYGVEMKDEVRLAAENAAHSVYESNTDLIKEIGATEEDIREIMELYAWPDLMRDAMTADVDTEVSDEEAAQSRVVYARMRLADTDEDTKAAYKESMEQLLQKMQEADSLDEDTIRTMANEIDEENIMVGGVNLGKDDDFFDASIMDVLAGLQDGEVCQEVLEIPDSYYYLVFMDSVLDREATDREKTTIVNTRKQEAYDEILQGWLDGAAISTSKAWDALEVKDKENWKAVVPAAAAPETAETAETEDTAVEAESASTAESAAESAESASTLESEAETAESASTAESEAESAESASTAESEAETAESASTADSAAESAESAVEEAESASSSESEAESADK